MNILNYFRFNNTDKSSANKAKERLKIVVAHQRSASKRPAFIANLQKELLDVIAKYVHVDKDQIKVELDQADDCSVLELNVTFPNEAATKEN